MKGIGPRRHSHINEADFIVVKLKLKGERRRKATRLGMAQALFDPYETKLQHSLNIKFIFILFVYNVLRACYKLNREIFNKREGNTD